MANGGDELIDALINDNDAEPAGWLITVVDEFGDMMVGFLTEEQARAAFAALKMAYVLGDGGTLKLENRDENENWIVMDSADLP